MKRLMAILAALVLFGSACADVVTIDTDTATVEELMDVIERLNAVITEKNNGYDVLPRVIQFATGMTVRVMSYEVKDGILYVHCMFSHQLEQPLAWGINILYKAYQHGQEIKNHENWPYGLSTTVLAGSETEVILTFELEDDSDVTIFFQALTALYEYKQITLSLK